MNLSHEVNILPPALYALYPKQASHLTMRRTSRRAGSDRLDRDTNAAINLHGAEWRQWIVGNLARGCSPLTMARTMVEKVWTYADAADALDEAMAELKLSKPWRVQLPSIPESRHIATSDGHVVTVQARFRKPAAVLLDGLLTDGERRELIDYAIHKGMSRSFVVAADSGSSIGHDGRTSTGTFMTRGETPLIERLERRLSELTGWPEANAEGLQVLRYQDGQEYRPHFDWFDSRKPGSAAHLARGGQRLATTVIYLAVPESGGGTSFPNAGVEVLPGAGGAIFFHDVDEFGAPDPMSLHAGQPVEKGVKVVATFWQRQGPFREPDAVDGGAAAVTARAPA